MNSAVKEAIYNAVEREPFARALGMKLVELKLGYSAVEMMYKPSAVALNVNVTYVSSPEPGKLLRAEAREITRTKKTAGYDIKVTEKGGRLIATCQALAYRTGKAIPFLKTYTE